jgi:acyl-CoA-binding protein
LTGFFGACYQRSRRDGMGRSKMATKKTAATKPAAKTDSGKSAGDLDQQFEAAAKAALKMKEDPGNEMKLRLYALYKQATEGDVNGPRPGMFDFVGAAKYDAWAKLKGTGRDEAKKKYIELVKRLS